MMLTQSRLSATPRDEGGFSLVEILVAISIVTVGVLGLLSVITGVIRQQSFEKQQANAIRIATGTLESASQEAESSTTWAELVSAVGAASPVPISLGGTTFTENVTTTLCSATDPATTCTTPSGNATPVVRALVVVTWTNGGKTDSVTMTRTLAQTSTNELTSGSSNLADGIAGTGGLNVSVGVLSLSPNPASLNSNNHPTSAITVTLTMLSTSSASSIPLSWTDENGVHSTTLTGSGLSYSATIPANSITAVSSDEVVFNAKVPSSPAVPTATLTFNSSGSSPSPSPTVTTSSPSPSPTTTTSSSSPSPTATPITGSCTISQTGVLPPYSVTYACTTTGLSKTDSVVATNLLGIGGATLTSTNGTSWTVTKSQTLSLLNATVTFTMTRASDGATYQTTYVLGH